MKKLTPFFSIIISVYNGEKTIETCLKSIFLSSFKDFEVVVVDDGSTDKTAELVEKFDVKLIKFKKNKGPSWGRNAGAQKACGKFYFFTDADCIFDKNLIKRTYQILNKDELSILGGTYHPISADEDFFSDFQSIFVHFFETKNEWADYIATHFLVIKKLLFDQLGGFYQGTFLGRVACSEDVEFSHRAKNIGLRLKVYPELTVKHIFRYSLYKSLRNAFLKSYTWTWVSAVIMKDLASDSGTGSKELKLTVGLLLLFLLSLFLSFWHPIIYPVVLLSFVAMPFINRYFFRFIFQKRGFIYGTKATLYYLFPYSFAAGLGASLALIKCLIKKYPQ